MTTQRLDSTLRSQDVRPERAIICQVNQDPSFTSREIEPKGTEGLAQDLIVG